MAVGVSIILRNSERISQLTVASDKAHAQLVDKNIPQSCFTALSTGQQIALGFVMLELTTFQIFFMVLHGALLIFLVAFLSRGASQKRDNVVSLSDVRQRKRKKKKRSTPPQSFSTQFTPPPPEPLKRETREVREVREVRDLLEAREANSAEGMIRYSLAAGQRKSS